MRVPLVAANWKMHTTLEEAMALVRAMTPELAHMPGVELALCPPFPWLTELSRLLSGTSIVLGAQNMHFEDRGGFTGEVSPLMLKGLCKYVVLGHSERRVQFRETEWLINRKVLAAVKHGLTPILCVGETADQLERGETALVVGRQLETGLRDVSPGSRIVLAYDPVWATMGMVTPTAARNVNDLCGYIRDRLSDLSSPEAAEEVRVLYGGSIAPTNIAEIAAQPQIDGVLVGSASLTAGNFVAIARAIFEAASSQLQR